MKKQKKEKKRFYLFLFLLIIIGLGYAVLSQQLSINGGLEYGSMKWDVGFKSVTDGGGTINSNPTIADDKKSITITCNIGTSTNSETCITKATINNDSSFNIKLKENPTITSNDAYVESVDIVWIDSTTNTGNVKAGASILKGEEQNIVVNITTKKLSEDTIPSSSLSVPITIDMNWEEDNK